MLLHAHNVTFRYGRAPAPAIDDVSLTIGAGEIVGLLGPNGSGKTTLIKLLSGALVPSSGAVHLDGRVLTTLSRSTLARQVAVVPQETHLAFEYSALEIVLMGRYPRLRAFEVEGPDDVASAIDALAATGTADVASRPFPTLSGGEKQRVVIAAALAQLDDRSRQQAADSAAWTPGPGASTSALFLDEPTASLDLRYQLELTGLLRRLNRDRGITMLVSTHDLALASALCTTIVLMARGRVLASGPPREMLTAPLLGELYGLEAALVASVLR